MENEGVTLENNLIAKYAGILSIIEIGLGSFLHAFKIPLSGQLLSLNQIFILSHASLKIKDPGSGGVISTTSALLKSLSPAGKKLTPMLAIATQGHLFSLGLHIFGVNILGRSIGAVMSSLWAYIQPLCLYLILFGKDLIFIYDYFFKKISKIFNIDHQNFLLILFSIILFKVLLSLCAVILAYKVRDEQLDKFTLWAKSQKKEKKVFKKQHNPYMGALIDLWSPLFVISLILTFTFFYFAKSVHSNLIWILLRPLAMGYIIFFCLRVMPLDKFIDKLKDGRYKEVLKRTLKRIQE